MNPIAGIGQRSTTAIVVFFLFVGVTLILTYWAARRTRSAKDFFAAGGKVKAWQNGLALAGDFIAAAGFLGVPGLIALIGFDALVFTYSPLVAFALLMLLIAEPVRNLGKYTFADVLSYRLNSSSIRVIASISTIYLVLNYILMQMVGTGNLIGMMFGIPYGLAVVICGVLMLIYVLFGGMLAATWVQIIKCVLMVLTTIFLAVLVLAAFGFDFTALFKAAVANNGIASLAPGRSRMGTLETISIGLSLGLGTASLPHVLMRIYTVPDARTARKSMFYAVSVMAVFYIFLIIVGFGAMALVGPNAIRAVDRGGNMALPQLALKLAGPPFLGFVAAISFATILAVITGLMITGAATLSHDIWVSLIKRGKATDRQVVVVAKIATVLLFVTGISLGILFRGQNLAFLVGLSNAVAASANFPVLILALFWRRLTTAGAVTGMLVGLCSSVLMIYLSPLIQVDILHHAAPIITLRNPGIFTVPLAFIAAIAVSLATYRPAQAVQYASIERRMLLGNEAVE